MRPRHKTAADLVLQQVQQCQRLDLEDRQSLRQICAWCVRGIRQVGVTNHKRHVTINTQLCSASERSSRNQKIVSESVSGLHQFCQQTGNSVLTVMEVSNGTR